MANFVFSVKTDNAGTSNDDQFTLPLILGGSYDFEVDWGDGSSNDTITAYDDAAVTHTFDGGADTYTVTIYESGVGHGNGTIESWQFTKSGDCRKITGISSWGPLVIDNDKAFYGCTNLNTSATDAPTLSGSMHSMFLGCSSLTTLDVSSWDVSSVTNMGYMFQECYNLTTLDVSSWAITDLGIFDDNSFNSCSSLTGTLDMSGWDVTFDDFTPPFLTGAAVHLDFGAKSLSFTDVNVDVDVADLTCGDLTLDGTGDLDFGSGDHSIADFTVTGSGDVDYGSATITTSGDFDISASSGAFTRGSGTWTFAKSGGTIKTTSGSGREFYGIILTGNYELLATSDLVLMWGSLTIDSGVTLTCNQDVYAYGSVFATGSTIDGSNRFYFTARTTATGTFGTVTVHRFYLRGTTDDFTLEAGTFACSDGFFFYGDSASDVVKLGTGAFIFDCDVRLVVDSGYSLTIDMVTNNPTISITGRVFDQIDGTLTWQKSSNGVTLNGTGNQDIDFDGSDIGPLTIASTGGVVTFSGPVECDSFSGEDGVCDPNGQTITVNGAVRFYPDFDFDGDAGGATFDYAGNFNANGQTINNLDFIRDAGGKHLAVNSTITNSTVTGDDMLAPSNKGNTDGGGNTGWDFSIIDSGLINRRRFLVPQ